MKGLTVPADTIVRCRDQPAVLAHALGEMVCGPWQHVVRRFEPGYMPRAVAIFQRAEAQEGMQMVRLAANRLDSGMQLAAIDIARHSGAGVALYDPPEHAIQQAPAMLGAKACGHLQLIEELPRYADARPVSGCWRGHRLIEQADVPAACPVHLMRCDLLLQQHPRRVSPALEASVEAHRAHHQSAICVGEPSRRCCRNTVDSCPARLGR